MTLQTGPFRFRIRSSEPDVARGLATLYAGFPLGPYEGLRDFHVSIDRVRVRRIAVANVSSLAASKRRLSRPS